MWSRLAFKRLIYSFPIQFLVLLIKKNHVLLLYWVILFYFVTGSLAQRFGIPYLFLDPEYMGHLGFRAFFIMGFATGSFIMVFNISSYIINSHRFPFIATLSRPFMKYCLNNFIVPVSFVLVYLTRLISFQVYYEYRGVGSLLFDTFGFILGLLIIIGLTLTYFFRTNQDIIKMFGIEASDEDPGNPFAEHIFEEREKRKFWKIRPLGTSWRVDTYLSSPLKIKLVRKTDHYKPEMLFKVINQNHLNAAVIEIVVFGMFIVLGLFKDHTIFQIPAGASIILIFAMFIMLSSAFRFWLRAWSSAAFIFLLLLLNFLSQYGFFYPQNKAYGLHYDKKANYGLDAIRMLANETQRRKDIDQNTSILNTWRNKFENKPKIVFVNCSGGGLRATMWTFRVMQVADSLTDNNLIQSSYIIAGASGGMIGAAYYRELYLRHKQGLLKNFHTDEQLYNSSKDLLNPIAFSITVSDLFFNFQKFKDGNTRYAKDRAYAFEEQMNNNMNHAFDKRLKDYREAEANASIPLMLFSPTIVNDGRRLFISSQPVSFLCSDPDSKTFQYSPTVDGVEFSKLLKGEDAENVKYSSVLRMNATFPYILPAVSLPTDPNILIMDAGIRDATGIKSNLRYMYVFRKWIEENTSGVIFVDIRDSRKEKAVEEKPRMTILQNLAAPLGNIYGNLLTIQDYNMDEALLYASSWFKGQFDFITFELPTKEQEISLSWHLTTREKKSVYTTIDLDQNKVAMKRLMELLKDNKARN